MIFINIRKLNIEKYKNVKIECEDKRKKSVYDHKKLLYAKQNY